MGFSAFDRIFRVERIRQRASPRGGFSVPALHEVVVPEDSGPYVSTTMRGTFVPTKRSEVLGGVVRFGFSPCPIGEEDKLITTLHERLAHLSRDLKWYPRCTSIQEAIARMRASGVEPKFMVLSEASLPEIMGKDADLETLRRTMALTGSVAKVDGMQVLLSGLPGHAALVTAAPSLVGLHIRIGDHVGVLVQRASRSIVVVERDVA